MEVGFYGGFFAWVCGEVEKGAMMTAIRTLYADTRKRVESICLKQIIFMDNLYISILVWF